MQEACGASPVEGKGGAGAAGQASGLSDGPTPVRRSGGLRVGQGKPQLQCGSERVRAHGLPLRSPLGKDMSGPTSRCVWSWSSSQGRAWAWLQPVAPRGGCELTASAGSPLEGALSGPSPGCPDGSRVAGYGVRIDTNTGVQGPSGYSRISACGPGLGPSHNGPIFQKPTGGHFPAPERVGYLAAGRTFTLLPGAAELELLYSERPSGSP